LIGTHKSSQIQTKFTSRKVENR